MVTSILAALRDAGDKPVTARQIHDAIGIGSRKRVKDLLDDCETAGLASSTLVPVSLCIEERRYVRSPALAADDFDRRGMLVYGDET